MIPTTKLRFVERSHFFPLSQESPRKFKVLQQWWLTGEDIGVVPSEIVGEWRDVPLEVEE